MLASQAVERNLQHYTIQERQDSSGRPVKPIDKAAQVNHFKNILGLESFIVGQLSEEQIVNPLDIAHWDDTQSTDYRCKKSQDVTSRTSINHPLQYASLFLHKLPPAA
jgi:hypothetical protein